MSDDGQVSGADDVSGANTQTPEPQSGARGGADDGQGTVAREDYERVKRDMLKYKDERKALTDRQAEMQAAIEKLQTERKREAEDYKGLYEETLGKYETEREKRQKMFDGLVRETKARKALPELKKRGLRDDALNLLDYEDFSDIDHEMTDQGTIIAHDTSSFVDRFQQRYPYAFEKPKPPSVNNGGGGGSAVDGGDITIEKLAELQRNRNKSPEDKARYLDARKRFESRRQA